MYLMWLPDNFILRITCIDYSYVKLNKFNQTQIRYEMLHCCQIFLDFFRANTLTFVTLCRTSND